VPFVDQAGGGQQLAFWNAHHDERGFAPMNIQQIMPKST